MERLRAFLADVGRGGRLSSLEAELDYWRKYARARVEEVAHYKDRAAALERKAEAEAGEAERFVAGAHRFRDERDAARAEVVRLRKVIAAVGELVESAAPTRLASARPPADLPPE
jgi:predicted  nucleic acid-binding Zn-ribbon protein